MALTSEIAQQIVEAGTLAPSGDNMQPWVATWRGETLHLSIDPARDQSLYNFKYRASLIALGAMIENIVIAARQFGLDTEIAFSPDGEWLLAAALRFHHRGGPQDALFGSIARRCTNRKPYYARPVSREVLEQLRGSLPDDGLSTLQLIETEEDRRIVAKAASVNDRLLFEIRQLHDGLFDCVRWTAKEAQETGDGLYAKTLELGATGPGFRAMRSWPMVRIANLMGASRTAPFHSYRTFLRSPVFGFLRMQGVSRELFVEGGRRMQRVWLTITSLGLSFQPMVGVLYLLPYLRSNAVALDPPQRALLVKAETSLKRVISIDEGTAPILLFRFGYSEPPSATSLRRVRG